MDSSSTDLESGIESDLIDLSTVPMTVLRELDDTVFRKVLQRVMQQASHPRVTVGGGSGRRAD